MHAIIGIIGGILTVGILGYQTYEVISTESWRNWNLFDWFVNIGLMIITFLPFVGELPALGKILSGGFGMLAKYLQKVPLIGKIVDWIWALRTGFRTFYESYMMKWFAKGGWLYNFGKRFSTLAKQLRNPWVLFAVLFLSSMADGIFSQLYQMWGDITLRAANASFEAISRALDKGGYGNPISEAIAVLRGAKSSLPPCFTAIWGAVGASTCIGLIVTTLQYMALLSALREGYKLYGRGT